MSSPAGWYNVNGQQTYWDGTRWVPSTPQYAQVAYRPPFNASGLTGFIIALAAGLFLWVPYLTFFVLLAATLICATSIKGHRRGTGFAIAGTVIGSIFGLISLIVSIVFIVGSR